MKLTILRTSGSTQSVLFIVLFLGHASSASRSEAQSQRRLPGPPAASPSLFPRPLLPFESEPELLLTADVDKDRDTDLIVYTNHYDSTYGYQPSFHVEKNDGRGVFSSTAPRSLQNEVKSMAARDLDGDGDVDLVMGLSSHAFSVRFNTGSGVFGSGTSYGSGDTGYSIAISDMDGDQDRDVVVGAPGKVQVYTNVGGGAFTLFNSKNLSATPTRVMLSDLDSDGDEDVVAGSSGDLAVLKNDGTGAIESRVYYSASPSNFFGKGDLDRDLDEDLIVSAGAGYSILTNDGSGTFIAGPVLPGSGDLKVVDLDANGYEDLLSFRLVPGAGRHDIEIVTYLNGRRGFGPMHTYPTGAADYWLPSSLVVDDLNGDRLLDTAFISYFVIHLALNDGLGGFTGSARQTPFPGFPFLLGEASFDDFDGDGTKDLLYSGADACDYNVYMRQGQAGGTFGAPLLVHTSADACTYGSGSDLLGGDLRGSGRDLLARRSLWNVGQWHYILLANGFGGYDSSAIRIQDYCCISDFSYDSTAIGQLDGLGENDFVHSHYLGLDVYMNNGDGTFAPFVGYGGWPNGTAVTIADLDGDSFADVIGSCAFTWSPPHSSWVSINYGLGNGVLASTVKLGEVGEEDYPEPPRDCIVGDWNDDGLLDIAKTEYTNRRVAVFLNIGNRSFTPQTYGMGIDQPECLEAGDLDADSDLDLVVVSDSYVMILLNQGNGTFVSGGYYDIWVSDGVSYSRTPMMIDLGQDSDLDLLLDGALGRYIVLENSTVP